MTALFTRFEDYSFAQRSRRRRLPFSLEVVFGAGLTLLSYLVLPAAAQVATGVQVSELLKQRGLGWVWIFFILLAFGNTCGPLLSLISLRERQLPGIGRPLPLSVYLGLSMFILLSGAVIGLFVAKVLGST